MEKLFKLFLWSCSICFCFASCDTQQTCTYLNSEKIDKGLYLEWYETCRGGVLAGNCYDYYVTDSVSFRSFVGQRGDHGFFSAKLEGDGVKVFTLENRSINDTLKVLNIELVLLKTENRFDSLGGYVKPIIGPVRHLCGKRLREGTEKVDTGVFLETDQYHCDERYINAVYLTDSLRFRRLLGMYTDLNWETRYSAKLVGDNVIAYETAYRNVRDTLKTVTFPMSDLRKSGYVPVCPRNNNR